MNIFSIVLKDNKINFQGYYYAKEYIAAQGPKPNTAHDFWRMVLQRKVESIVMLTSLVENNKVKCHEYFPKLNGRVSFDNIRIVCTSEQNHSNYVKRILEVEKVIHMNLTHILLPFLTSSSSSFEMYRKFYSITFFFLFMNI